MTFGDTGGSGLDTTTIDGDELTLSGVGVGTAALSGTATLLSGTTYRFGFTGDFVVGSADVNFVAGTWRDTAGNANVAETESFTVQVDPTGGVVATVRVRLTDKDYLHMTEVEVLEQGTGSNLAPAGTATQSSTYNTNTGPEKAIDGDRTSNYPTSVSITQWEFGAWWEVDLGGGFDVGTITVYNRPSSGTRLEGAVVEALNSGGSVVWSDTITGATDGSLHTFVVSATAASNVGVAEGSISEKGGTTTGPVSRSGDTTGDLVVTLSSSDTTETTVQATVTILDGQATANFNIDAVDDAILDGTQTTITASATDFTSGQNTLDVLDDDLSQYQIDVVFIDSGLAANQQSIFTNAANRWAEIIIGDVSDVFVPGSFFTDGIGRNVDDIAIEARAPAIDGVDGILDQAGPMGIRSGSFLPAVEFMRFDSADVASLEASGQLADVILHEMDHVIGLIAIWGDLKPADGCRLSRPTIYRHRR